MLVVDSQTCPTWRAGGAAGGGLVASVGDNLRLILAELNCAVLPN